MEFLLEFPHVSAIGRPAAWPGLAGRTIESRRSQYYISAKVMERSYAVDRYGQRPGDPAQTRPNHLGLKPGDQVKFFIHPDGTVVMLPTLPASALRGMLERPGRKPVTTGEMDEGIAAAVGERDARGKRR